MSKKRRPTGANAKGTGTRKKPGRRKKRTPSNSDNSTATSGPSSSELDDLSAELSEAIGEIQSLNDDTPGKPLAPKRRRTTTLKRPKSKGGTKKKGSGKEGAPAANRQPGAEIGRFHRTGLSLAVKFSIFISILIILISSLFGLVVISIFKGKLENEIIRTGYNQAVSMKGFATTIYETYKEKESRNPQLIPREFVKTDQGKGMKQVLKQIVEADRRVYDVAILFSHRPTTTPDIKLMTVHNTKKFTPANTLIDIDLSEATQEIKVWKGTYTTASNEEEVYFFQVPVKKRKNKLLATANLVISRKEVDMEVNQLIVKIALFGTMFVGAGIAFSLFLASVVTSPINGLVRDMDIVARGDLDHSTKPQTKDEIGLLASAFNRMTQNLRQARDQERQVERLNSELKLAEDIHTQLMPKKLPDIPGYDIYTCCHSAKEVGGDYYDFIPVDSEHLAVVIADVSGKGIPGSMVMGTTRTILRMVASGNLSPADVLSKTNHWVSRDIKRGMFVTSMYVILNVRNKEMVVASAGHNPIVIWRQKTRQHELVRPNGIALGFDKGPIFDRTIREQRIQLHSGDRVVLYTDGVPECMSEDHEEWGDDALFKFVRQYAERDSKQFIRLLTKALQSHQGAAEQHDDITVTTFRVE